jgi:hypothetical protein
MNLMGREVGVRPVRPSSVRPPSSVRSMVCTIIVTGI